MPACLEAAPTIAPSPPSTDGRAARMAKFKREQLIVDYLNRGVSVAEIAACVGVGEKRMCALIGEILARRTPAPCAEFVAIQVSRLNEALLVAYSAMTGANLKAVDRVVRIVRELDRYHGFVAAERRRPERPRIEADAQANVGLGVALFCSAELALQDGEIERAASSAGVVSVVRDSDDRPEIPPQASEKVDSAPGISKSPPDAWAASPDLVPPLGANQEASNDGADWSERCDGIVRRVAAALHNAFGGDRPIERGDTSTDRVDSKSHAVPAVDDRPEIPPQALEKAHFTPGILASHALDVCHRREGRSAAAAAAAFPMEARLRTPDAAAPQTMTEPASGPTLGDNRPENPPQASEIIDSAPGHASPAGPAPSSNAPDEDFHIPAAWRRPNVRMALNGLLAVESSELRPNLPPQLSIFSASMKASCGISTLPNWRMRFLPAFCFSRSLRLRVASPP